MFCFLKRQFLYNGTHFLKYITIWIFDHSTNLFWRCLHTRCTLANINTVRLHPLGLQVIRLITSFSNFNSNNFIIFRNIPHKHGYIRCNSITNAIGQAGVSIIYIVNTGHITVIINANVDNTTIRIRKCYNFLINVIDHLRFIFNTFTFILHTLSPPLNSLSNDILYYTFLFHFFQYIIVKIHFYSLLKCENS